MLYYETECASQIIRRMTETLLSIQYKSQIQIVERSQILIERFYRVDVVRLSVD